MAIAASITEGSTGIYGRELIRKIVVGPTRDALEAAEYHDGVGALVFFFVFLFQAHLSSQRGKIPCVCSSLWVSGVVLALWLR